jgi:ketosteroid isomerase-like protein
MKSLYLGLLFPLFILFYLQEHRQDMNYSKIQNEKQLVEDAIRNSIGWAKNKDLTLLHSVIANDSAYLEVDPDNRVVKGFEDFRKSEKIWMSPDFKALWFEIRDLTINISRSGDAAWFFGILNDINEWKGQPANWVNARWTGVLEKRNEKWVIVQMHFSYASD